MDPVSDVRHVANDPGGPDVTADTVPSTGKPTTTQGAATADLDAGHDEPRKRNTLNPPAPERPWESSDLRLDRQHDLYGIEGFNACDW